VVATNSRVYTAFGELVEITGTGQTRYGYAGAGTRRYEGGDRAMISIEQATDCLQKQAAELMDLNYDELRALADRLQASSDEEWPELKRLTVDGETLHICALIRSWGLRRRVSVELLALNDDGTISPKVIPGVYFERFKSGRLYWPNIEWWQLSIVGIVVVAIVAAYILWRLKGSSG